MRLRLFTRVAAIVAAGALVFFLTNGARTAARADQADVQRGMYLAGDAGQCADCHGQGLKGAPLRFTPIGLPPGVPFADTAPSLVGLTMFASDADAVKFFSTGMLPSGQPARPPMPQYRFNDADAHAIVAYLRSLKT
jgi:mono/diheme cytochrome c family protein